LAFQLALAPPRLPACGPCELPCALYTLLNTYDAQSQSSALMVSWQKQRRRTHSLSYSTSTS